MVFSLYVQLILEHSPQSIEGFDSACDTVFAKALDSVNAVVLQQLDKLPLLARVKNASARRGLGWASPGRYAPLP